jgi:acyl-CoA hydrolase
MEPAKPVSASKSIISLQMLPSDVNPMGNVHGGTILKLVDVSAAVAAMRHARTNVVSASIDRMDFFHPVYVGNLLILKASVNFAGHTSMEVGVRIEAEDLKTGKVTHTGSSYITYVALNEEGRPTEVPQVIPQTAEEKRRYRDAKQRRAQRIAILARRARQHRK